MKVNSNKIYFAYGYFVVKSNQFYEVLDEVILTEYKDLNVVTDYWEKRC